jgi:type II secretory pathway pseudopilin PulG
MLSNKEKKMKPIIKQSNKKAAFTIVELLTVMSIIVILIGLLVPSLNMAKRYAKKVRQKAQFHSIEAAIELFNNEFDGYPDSREVDPTGQPYCGAMKLCEAMMGQDLMGFHPDSAFRSDGTDGFNRDVYPPNPNQDNLRARKGPYVQLESANACKLEGLYANTRGFDPTNYVLCDVYDRATHRLTGKRIGMPILYYRADTSRDLHLCDAPDDPGNIYNYRDNHELVSLGMPWDPPPTGPMPKLFADPQATPPEPEGKRFYWNTRNDKIDTASRPYRADSYILISAGFDGEYGTSDDICNFDWKYRETLP